MKYNLYIFILITICINGCRNISKNEENSNSSSTESIVKQNGKFLKPEQQIKILENYIVFKNNKSDYKSKIDTTYLFKTWAMDLKDPSASFQISSKDLLAIDFDGIGERSYVIKDMNIKIYDGNFTDEGDILRLTKDSLYITWKATGITVRYVEWKDN